MYFNNNNNYDEFNDNFNEDNYNICNRYYFDSFLEKYNDESFFNNDYLTDNQLWSFFGENTSNDFSCNDQNNHNSNEIKPKEPFVKSITNSGTNFVTKQENKSLIFNITKEEKKTHLGRKRKHNIGGKHNKFSSDNMAIKIKTKIFDCILLLLNNSIKKEINENKKKQNELICSKFLFKIDQKVIKDINTNKNKKFLKTKIKDIFYLNKVSEKYNKNGFDYNKKIIENIYKYNTQKKTIFILEKTFFECLEHFRGSKFYEELIGLEKEYINIINEFENEGESEDYIDNFKYLVNRYEKYFEEKIPRKNRKN